MQAPGRRRPRLRVDRLLGSLLSLLRMHWDHEPPDSVGETSGWQARGLPHWQAGRLPHDLPVHGKRGIAVDRAAGRRELGKRMEAGRAVEEGQVHLLAPLAGCERGRARVSGGPAGAGPPAIPPRRDQPLGLPILGPLVRGATVERVWARASGCQNAARIHQLFGRTVSEAAPQTTSGIEPARRGSLRIEY